MRTNHVRGGHIAFLSSANDVRRSRPVRVTGLGLELPQYTGSYPWSNNPDINNALSISFPNLSPGSPTVYRYPDGSLSTVPPSQAGGGGGNWESVIASALNVGSGVASQFIQSRNPAAFQGGYVDGQYYTNPNDLALAISQRGVSATGNISPWMIGGALGLVLLLVVMNSGKKK